jgi:menaquinone-dependent protoporphyrinogen oxidase
MANLLMVYQTTDGQTRKIVEFIAEVARAEGHLVEVAATDSWSAGGRAEVQPQGVLLAASVHVGRHAAEATRWVHENREALDDVPTAFVSVSLSAAGEDRRHEAAKYVVDFLEETGWRPTFTATVAGALRYTRYNFVKRTMMKQIASRGGLPTDTSKDHEFTDWEEVRRVAASFFDAVAEGGVGTKEEPASVLA